MSLADPSDARAPESARVILLGAALTYHHQITISMQIGGQVRGYQDILRCR